MKIIFENILEIIVKKTCMNIESKSWCSQFSYTVIVVTRT